VSDKDLGLDGRSVNGKSTTVGLNTKNSEKKNKTVCDISLKNVRQAKKDRGEGEGIAER